MHSMMYKQAQASAPELDAKSVKDEAASQSAVNEQVSDAGNDEDRILLNPQQAQGSSGG